MNGLEKFPLVLPDSGVVHLSHQFGVLIDEPRLPENIRSCVFHLQAKERRVAFKLNNEISVMPKPNMGAFTYSFC